MSRSLGLHLETLLRWALRYPFHLSLIPELWVLYVVQYYTTPTRLGKRISHPASENQNGGIPVLQQGVFSGFLHCCLRNSMQALCDSPASIHTSTLLLIHKNFCIVTLSILDYLRSLWFDHWSSRSCCAASANCLIGNFIISHIRDSPYSSHKPIIWVYTIS